MAKKTTEIAVKSKEKKKAMWLGADTLMGNVVPGSKEEKERALIKMTARVLDVSPFGVNILGSLPYINKLGLSQKESQYTKGKGKFEYRWVKVAMDDTEKAICECRIVCGPNEPVTDWIMGECSPKTMKMGTLAGYQNHMAQTRAKNRAILEAFGVQIHEDMLSNINFLYQDKKISGKQAQALEFHAGKATSTSIEEVEADKNVKPSPISSDLFGVTKEDMVPGPDGDPVVICKGCRDIITEQEAKFSKKMFGKPLCRDCQKLAKRK